MKKNIYALLSIIALVLLQSCTEPVPPVEEPTAKLMTIDEIKNTHGFTWYQKGYDKYSYDSSLIKELKSKLMNTDKSFLIFVNPSCACVGTQEYFPAIVKILQNAGVNENKFKVYTTRTPEEKNPYNNILKINYLPAFFVMQNEVPLKSVLDSIVIYKETKPQITIEESLLKCLNQ